MKTHPFYVTTADPSDAWSNHWSNAPEEDEGDEKETIECLFCKSTDTELVEKKNTTYCICNDCGEVFNP